MKLGKIVTVAALLASCSTSSPGPLTPAFSGLTMMGDSVIFRMGPYTALSPAPFRGSVDLGVGGAPTSQIAHQIASIPPTTKWVLLEGGGDDLLQGTASQIVPNYVSMLSTIPLRFRVVMVGIFHIDGNNTNIDSINAQLNPLCIGHPNCTVAANAQHLNMTGLTVDGIHPNRQGYALIMQALSPYLK